ncbi:hypothetical protein AXK11_00095 [Cephaloticoccus primus]|uniref:DUF4861 domain-containing protein n=1 Tax=Cephaloticoccus primus TaxID=1548207 RepID=A0A139SSY9_9BACT|nr:DUF4861 family protein [Cephaloticoccus primus]KXU37676.1 hypothetical protein AXK11_00095 [Cephaloticoccus primus]
MKKNIIAALFALLGLLPFANGQGAPAGAGAARGRILVTLSGGQSWSGLVSIPYADFAQRFGVGAAFHVVDDKGRAVSHQLERLGMEAPQNVLLQVQLNQRRKLELLVFAGEKAPLPPKTFARYVPERFDDFAWENDRVAFRLYGEALEGKPGDAQGMDFWAKRTDQLIIDKWYKNGDYHRDHGDGLDYYSVGQTLGAGDVALYFGDEVHYTRHYRQYEVLDNGPLRTTFRLTYPPEVINGQRIGLRKTISLDAGSHFNKITLEVENRSARETPIVIGVAKRSVAEVADVEFLWEGDHTLPWETFSYWEPEIADHGRTGVALILPQGTTTFVPDEAKQFLFRAVVRNGEPYTYYNGAAWNKAGAVTNLPKWYGVVREKADSLRATPEVTLEGSSPRR